nr:hypothetical protein [Tanacetum cinerariifolium]
MNQDFYSLGFDQLQPPQCSVIHQPPQELSIQEMEDLKQQYLDELKRLSNLKYRDEIKIAELTENLNGMSIEIREKEKLLQQEQWAYLSTHPSKRLTTFCYDDYDDDYNSAITPALSTEEPVDSLNELVDSLSIGDEHLETVLATESDEFIKSSVENLVPNPSGSEGENGCDVPACFTTLSNILFDDDYEFDSVDDQSCSDEDVPKKIFLNLLFDEEIISMKIDPHHFNVELILFSMSSSTLLKLNPPGIDETDCHPENEIHLTKRLLYDNSSPRPPKEFFSDNSDAEIESFSPSPILVKDSDSLMEEIDLSFTPDDPMPPSIEEDDYDSERDILILKELLDDYSFSLPKNESFHFDIPLFSHPPAKPPDGNTGILNIKMMGDIFDQKFLIITLVLNQEKSHDLLPHRSLEIFQLSAKCPMMIHGKNIPTMDIPLFYFYPLDQFKYGGIRSSSVT